MEFENYLLLVLQTLLIFDQEPVQAFSYISRLIQTALFTAITALDNNGIVTSLSTLRQNYIKIFLFFIFDIYASITKITSNMSVKFTNTVDKSWNNFNIISFVKLCQDPTKYIFLGSYHFSSTVHQIISDAIWPFLWDRFSRNTPECYIQSFP